MTEKPENSGPKQNTKIRPGASGNPAGKPKGTRHRATQMAEKLMENDATDVVNAVITAAKQGDMVAARLILERIAPRGFQLFCRGFWATFISANSRVLLAH